MLNKYNLNSSAAKSISPVLLFLTILFGFTEISQAIGDVRLVQVSIDNSLACRRKFYKASIDNRNVLYMTPRITQGNGPIQVSGAQSTKIISVDHAKNGNYKVTLYVYFPINDEKLGVTLASQKTQDLDSCDLVKIKKFINEGIVNKEDKIDTIDSLPLTSIDIAIPNVKNIGRVGVALRDGELTSRNSNPIESNQLNTSAESAKQVKSSEPTEILYLGQSLPVEFILSPDEYDEFSSAILSKEGVDTEVIVRFQGKGKSGSISAEYETESIMKKLTGEVSGKRMLSELEFKAVLNQSLTKEFIKITEETPSSDPNGVFEKVRSKMLEEIFATVSKSASTG